MDFDEIQTVIVNAHLTERMGSSNQSFRWRLRPGNDEMIIDLTNRYLKPKSRAIFHDMLQEPAGVYMFRLFLSEKAEQTDVQYLEFYAGIVNLFKSSKNDRPRVAHVLLQNLPGSKGNTSTRDVSLLDVEDEAGKVDPLRITEDDIALVAETLENEEASLDVLKPLLKKMEAKVWDEFFPPFLKSEYFLRYIQLYEYSRRPIDHRSFSKIRIVGKGAFGSVYVAEKLDTHKLYAWKEMDKRKLKKDKSFDVALNELKRLAEVKSPYVCGLTYSFQTEKSVVLALDFYSGGDLKYHMKYASPDRKKKPFEQHIAKFYTAEILLGLQEMHKNGVIYRDLKPANILLDEDGHIHISDLGLAKKLTKERPYSTGLSGTPGYWAPEVLCRTPYSVWADWWSFGILLYELLCGKRPPCICKKGSKQWCTFSDRKESEENALSDDGIYTQELYFPMKYFTPDAEDLIRKLLHPKKNQRLGYHSVEEIKNHPYFSDIDWAALNAGKISSPFVPKKRGINAKSIAEVGDFDSREYRKVRLTGEDDRILSQFEYHDPKIVQLELVGVLQARLHKDGKFTETDFIAGEQQPEHTAKCCVIS